MLSALVTGKLPAGPGQDFSTMVENPTNNRELGYLSWRACVQAKFGQGQSQIYRLLDAARVEQNISPWGKTP